MNRDATTRQDAATPAAGPSAASIPSAPQALVAAALRRMRVGELTIVTPDAGEHVFSGVEPGPAARVLVRDRSLARRVITGGSIGLAESYMDGAWDSPDLGAVLDLGLENLSRGWAANVPVVFRPAQRLWHAVRDNDARGGSKRNVSYHYDLGNDFYELWLDDTMTYSAACFSRESADSGGSGASSDQDASRPPSAEELALAQRRKWDRILELIQPARGDHVLEIGCGWGGFAIHAAKEAGCRVTGLTLSEEQAQFARTRVREHGLDGQVDIRLQDYREVGGTFNAIASIEMFEAVGEKWWPTFFRRMRSLLERGGAAGLQTITIAEDRFERYRRRADFIQRYIFPGGMLPSPGRFRESAQAAGLVVDAPRFFGHDYARTLAAWSERFEAALPEIRRLGFDERFIRMWRYYLAYCRTGFEHGTIDVMQVRLRA